ncbi:hypothetical protein JOC48_001584 [Aquibacillus albus]|uniref:Uncharacterized protein n=1 Tax=Aquibacillus albus TaxID=1168171 RepID=A0ABS2MYX9_9BACI|nr:hypothetical protein [Aquibacillus albus]
MKRRELSRVATLLVPNLEPALSAINGAASG